MTFLFFLIPISLLSSFANFTFSAFFFCFLLFGLCNLFLLTSMTYLFTMCVSDFLFLQFFGKWCYPFRVLSLLSYFFYEQDVWLWWKHAMYILMAVSFRCGWRVKKYDLLWWGQICDNHIDTTFDDHITSQFCRHLYHPWASLMTYVIQKGCIIYVYCSMPTSIN